MPPPMPNPMPESKSDAYTSMMHNQRTSIRDPYSTLIPPDSSALKKIFEWSNKQKRYTFPGSILLENSIIDYYEIEELLKILNVRARKVFEKKALKYRKNNI